MTLAKWNLYASQIRKRRNDVDIDTRDIGFLKSWLFRHADRIGRTLRKQKLQGRVITLKIKYADFRIMTRRVTLDAPTSATETIYETACDLLDHMRLEEKSGSSV